MVKIINNRLIVEENSIDDACEKITKIVQNKLDSLGHANVIAQVEPYFECYNDELSHFWHEIDINLITSEGLLGCIQYVTDNATPSLVNMNGKFLFYFIFDQSSNTLTSEKYMKNTGHCNFNKNNDLILENLLIDEIIKKLGE